jgi:hypothetical protein
MSAINFRLFHRFGFGDVLGVRAGYVAGAHRGA